MSVFAAILFGTLLCSVYSRAESIYERSGVDNIGDSIFERSGIGGKNCTHFNYQHDGSDWASLCPEWFLCGNGTMQSPIDLPLGQFATTHRPAFGIPTHAIPGRIFNRGQGIQWNPSNRIEDHDSTRIPTMRFDESEHNLLQWHIHTPSSEHTYGGEMRDGEIHFVFGHYSGEALVPKAVVGLGISKGHRTDRFYERLFEQIPSGSTLPPVGDNSTFDAEVDFSVILDSFHLDNYWTYRGSLTTPPCTEGERWFLGAGNTTLTESHYGKMVDSGISDDREIQPTTPEHEVNV